MSKRPKKQEWTDNRRMGVLAGVAAGAGLIGALIGRMIAPTPQQQAQSPRPIVQIVRPRPGLPSLAPTVTAACPSVAFIVSGQVSTMTGPSALNQQNGAPAAFAVSADGWLLTSATLQGAIRLNAVFSDGRNFPVQILRVDPVSGLALAKVSASNLPVLSFVEQELPSVGDFGFTLQSPAGRGCTADVAMIGSDFLANGGGPVSYIRVQTPTPDVAAGTPFLNSDGKVVGVATANAANEGDFLPASVVATIVDELIRGQASPSIAFGFRASDFSGTLASRLPNSRSRGAGVALVQPKSEAGKAGLQAGDVVVAVDGAAVSSASELNRALDAAKNGAVLDVIRGDQRLKMNILRSSS